jgi:1-acyl-sn-glycerol-3-phosphate acyltransferase
MTARPPHGQASDVPEAGRADLNPGSRFGRLDEQAPPRPLWRYRLIRLALRIVTNAYSSLRLEGAEMLPAGPSILCFSHQNWIDPFFLISALPERPRTHFFGPEQEDMTRGFRNGLMRWGGVAVPYRPGRRGLVAATGRVEELLAGGDRIAIAGEGRIHAGEGVVLPLLEGPAYMALRSGVPLVPVAVNGTSWLAFRRRVRVRIGRPVAAAGDGSRSATSEAVEAMTAEVQAALLELVSDFPDPPRSCWIGGRLTELFNDWPEGARPPVPPRGGTAADT